MKSGYRNPARARLWAIIPAVCLAACGGGGGDSGSASGGTGGGTPPPGGSTPPPNRAPVLVAANGEQFAIVGFPYDYDVTKSGRVFSDPDGDTLTSEAKLTANSFDRCDLTLTGLRVAGMPNVNSACDVMLTARDGRGGEATDWFTIRSRPNRPPDVALPNPNREVRPNSPIDYDATQGGQTFADADGHALAYEVSILSAPPGFSVQGTRIVGMLTGPGFAKVKIEARDAYGGVTADSFAFVVPSAISARPTLPATAYTYEDAKLPLPNTLRRQSNGIRAWADTTPDDNEITDAGATLGRVLFYDKRLSITNTHACGSCHEQSHNFASSQTFPAGCAGVRTKRSPMALADVRYNNLNRYFSDTRAGPLEQLALMPIEDRDELGSSSLAQLEQKLAAADYYPPLFAAAFGSPEVTRGRIAKALAQFLRSMISFESKWDRAFLQVDPAPPPDPATVLTAQEERGFNVFIEQQCFHCHGTPGFFSPWPDNNGIDEQFTDPGAGEGKFRPAALKNIAASGPYMHDGRFATIREVIEHYATGVKDSPFVAPVVRFPRNPSEEDKAALEAFFNSLTDEAFLTNPKFSDPFQ
jgi:cytochrome c peroxidase